MRKRSEEATIPKDISFAEAEAKLVTVVDFLEAQGIVPFSFPLPEGAAASAPPADLLRVQ
jgi:hypothetical protein